MRERIRQGIKPMSEFYMTAEGAESAQLLDFIDMNVQSDNVQFQNNALLYPYFCIGVFNKFFNFLLDFVVRTVTTARTTWRLV